MNDLRNIEFKKAACPNELLEIIQYRIEWLFQKPPPNKTYNCLIVERADRRGGFVVSSFGLDIGILPASRDSHGAMRNHGGLSRSVSVVAGAALGRQLDRDDLESIKVVWERAERNHERFGHTRFGHT